MHLFTYGTLQDEEIWSRLVNNEYLHEKACLDGYSCVYVENELYPALRKAADITYGKLYLHISEKDLTNLDIYEGNMYYRKEVTVFGQGSSNKYIAWCYFFHQEYLDNLTNHKWSLEHFQKFEKTKYLSSLNHQA